ncbi:hypothetical protein DFJ43DRAFT_663265 [Lentinula guzmanii]|uniref:Uncharacterized protein n=1 Tax=Lentinula guzmanii TaxID=2804957 RepID=A0AA38JDD8_9AGAR|nr:hypothetical protein DFJ43DRAFT_663265 [Lentinula guzmanii]
MKTAFVSSLAVVAVAMMTITAQAAALPTAALPTPTIVGNPSAPMSDSDKIQSDQGGFRASGDNSRYIHLNADGDPLVDFDWRQKQSGSSRFASVFLNDPSIRSLISLAVNTNRSNLKVLKCPNPKTSRKKLRKTISGTFFFPILRINSFTIR